MCYFWSICRSRFFFGGIFDTGEFCQFFFLWRGINLFGEFQRGAGALFLGHENSVRGRDCAVHHVSREKHVLLSRALQVSKFFCGWAWSLLKQMLAKFPMKSLAKMLGDKKAGDGNNNVGRFWFPDVELHPASADGWRVWRRRTTGHSAALFEICSHDVIGARALPRRTTGSCIGSMRRRTTGCQVFWEEGLASEEGRSLSAE